MPKTRGEVWWSVVFWIAVLGGGLAYSMATAPSESEQIERAIRKAQAEQRALRADTVRAIADCQATAIEHEELAGTCRESLKITLELNRSMLDSLQGHIEKLEAQRAALPADR